MHWFTADEHYDHNCIITMEERPFMDTGVMAHELVRRHNEVVEPGDVTYHLGDFQWGTKRSRIEELLRSMNGTHILVAGNHDACSDVHHRYVREVRRYARAGFLEVHQWLVLELEGIGRTLLTHLPALETLNAQEDQRYLDHRPIMDGYDAQLCGHCHRRWVRRGNSINVGVDVWGYKPVSLLQLAKFWEQSSELR